MRLGVDAEDDRSDRTAEGINLDAIFSVGTRRRSGEGERGTEGVVYVSLAVAAVLLGCRRQLGHLRSLPVTFRFSESRDR